MFPIKVKQSMSAVNSMIGIHWNNATDQLVLPFYPRSSILALRKIPQLVATSMIN